MELFAALNGRQSCRDFSAEFIETQVIEKIIGAGIMAPSPLNTQSWEFMVVSGPEMKEQLCNGAEAAKVAAIETSGWKWLETYSVAFLRTTPVIVVVVGDKTKSGVDTFSVDGPAAFSQACAAAVQNMLLAAHSLGLGSFWFTLFDKESVKELLQIDDNKEPLAFVCLGKPAKVSAKTPRKPLASKIVFIDK